MVPSVFKDPDTEKWVSKHHPYIGYSQHLYLGQQHTLTVSRQI